MRKTVKFSYDFGETTIKQLMKLGAEVETVEGSLVDNYFIEDASGFKFGRFKPRKHMMFLENYLNTWSSNHIVVLTDNDKLFYDTLEKSRADYEQAVNA